MMYWLALIALLVSATATAANQRLVSINPCFDDWLPQWVEHAWHVIPSSDHGNRLEQVLALEPDRVVAGSFVGRQLRLALQEHTQLTTMPYVANWQDWRAAVLRLGAELKQSSNAEAWLRTQEQALQELNLNGLNETLVLMPNGFTWGRKSWIYQLLEGQGVRLSALSGENDLVRLSLEDVLQSNPSTVILEGFSDRYARAHDWLWHDGLQDWLAQRRVIEVAGDLSSCADSRAIEYLRILHNGLAKELADAPL
ncbi:hypothetical protein ACQ5ES_11460 [Pseudidiomarina sp. E22-M8]|uniref:hypothetical protein n=1 Tax=Pseudidiomarina sp. E22-M8 TaxID=3424768 RepID=UPI00403CC7A5